MINSLQLESKTTSQHIAKSRVGEPHKIMWACLEWLMSNHCAPCKAERMFSTSNMCTSNKTMLSLPTEHALRCSALKGQTTTISSLSQMMRCVAKLLPKDKFVQNLKWFQSETQKLQNWARTSLNPQQQKVHVLKLHQTFMIHLLFQLQPRIHICP